ncbi:glycosyltransferase [Streptomyces tsukubensis]|uniref:Glycosyl transferase n=1 Tax=Streptomyces tsukubensis TaxID=83656 RepID=A0A1V4A5C4_9ACTN|nr:glycosyltransferase [Streptomyces tsukubensis]OON75371.1 hypothetical protein B1H18_23075 [Streptomyces tsukubensis]QFR95000.1 glycosyltransferase [Streptomyces tsukubensis]
MKVLHIITGLGVGGAEQQLRLLAPRLPARCEVVTLTNPGPVARGLREDGVPVTHLGMAGNRDIGSLPRLVTHIREGHYDLVHTHLYRACLYGRVAARLAGVRAVVATEHSLGDTVIEGRPLTPAVRGLYLASERLGSATVAVSPTVAERLRAWGVPEHRVHVVANGIDVDRFRFDPAARAAARAALGLPEDAYVVGGVGRLVAGKRFDALIRAMAALPDDHRLLLVGGGPEEEPLRRLAAELGLTDRVVLAGERDQSSTDSGERDQSSTTPGERGGAAATPGERGGAATAPGERDGAAATSGERGGAAATSGRHTRTATAPREQGLPALLAAMDVLVSPSRSEAFGLAVIEGLAAGLPVLYVDCPAVEDLPQEAAPGAHRVGGSVTGLTDALRWGRRTGYGTDGGHQRPGPGVTRLPVPDAVRHYSITRSAAQLADVYGTALAGAGGSRPLHRSQGLLGARSS